MRDHTTLLRAGGTSRVVPSEIVRVIDDYFPWAAHPDPPEKNVKIGFKENGRLAAILALVDRLPNDLIALPPSASADFVATVARLRSNLSAAFIKPDSYAFHGATLWRLRHVLHGANERSRAAAGHDLRNVRPKELREDLRADLAEAYDALCRGAWKSATV